MLTVYSAENTHEFAIAKFASQSPCVSIAEQLTKNAQYLWHSPAVESRHYYYCVQVGK